MFFGCVASHQVLVPLGFCWRAMHSKRCDAYQQCFRILGVPETSDQETVRCAYIELVKKVHPDTGTSEASIKRFQEIDEAFKMLQEKFSKDRRNITEEEKLEFDIKHTAPQHRQYLNFDGEGVGTPFQREKQYQQIKAMKAQERVLQHRIEKSTAGEQTLMKKGGNHYQRHAIKTKYGIERVVEDLIQEAMSKGDFNNLRGAGKPLSVAQSQNPYLDFTTAKLNKIMLDNGFTPEWISLNRDIRDGVKSLKALIIAERAYYGDYPLTPGDAEQWCAFLEQQKETVLNLNKMIDKYNLIVPILENQFFRLNLEKIGDGILQDKNLPHGKKRINVKQTSQGTGSAAEQDYLLSLFRLIAGFL